MPFAAGRAITFVGARVYGSCGSIASSLRIAGDRVAELNGPPHEGDAAIDLDGALVLPGLINSHDHLELNNFPRSKWRDRYANAGEWIADFQPRFEREPAIAAAMAVPLGERLLIGGIKNLLSGATTVCHHNPLYAPLRRRFPVRVVRRYRHSHSIVIGGEAIRQEFRTTPAGWPWIIHAAEGTDAAAAGEFSKLDAWECIGPGTVLVHGVGLNEESRAALARRGGALVWCPSSNRFLFGATAEVALLASIGRVALGTDSRLTGGRDLLDEMKYASEVCGIGPEDLVRMATADAAAALKLPQAGELRPGAPADLLVLPARSGSPVACVPQVARSGIRLVMLGGRARIGDADLRPAFAASGVRCAAVRLDGREKLMAEDLVRQIANCRVSEPGLEL
jgi:cytosine/adenosine deaminase-related metal-dependent hydrolase